MASTVFNVEWQTSLIIKCLFEDEDDVTSRHLDSHLETDGPASEDDSFDPVVIADKLKRIADALNEDKKFQAAMSDLKRAAAQEALESAFSNSVEALCSVSKAIQTREVTPEMQLITASVACGLYVKKSMPELKNKIQSIMASYLNRQVGDWVSKQGGWDKVPGV